MLYLRGCSTISIADIVVCNLPISRYAPPTNSSSFGRKSFIDLLSFIVKINNDVQMLSTAPYWIIVVKLVRVSPVIMWLHNGGA